MSCLAVHDAALSCVSISLMASVSPSSACGLLHVFNRYLFRGGEEAIVEKIHEDLSTVHPMTWCSFASTEWTGEKAPPVRTQAARLFYNRQARGQFEAALDASGAAAAVFHNVHPVGSPSLYHAALQRKLREQGADRNSLGHAETLIALGKALSAGPRNQLPRNLRSMKRSTGTADEWRYTPPSST